MNFIDVSQLTDEEIVIQLLKTIEQQKEQEWEQLDSFESGHMEHPMLLCEIMLYVGYGLPDIEFVYDIETTEFRVNDFTTFEEPSAITKVLEIVNIAAPEGYY